MKCFKLVNCTFPPLSFTKYLILLSILATVHCYSIVEGPSWQSEYPETRYINRHETNYMRDKLLQAIIKSAGQQNLDNDGRNYEMENSLKNGLKPMIVYQKIASGISKNELDKITNAMRNRLFGF